MSDRTLTDADVEAIASSLEKRLVENFYRDIGKGVWGFAKKTLIALILMLAAYGIVAKGLPASMPPTVPQ